MRLNLLQSINAVERDTVGSLLYPIIVYGCYLAYLNFDSMSMYYIPILVLAVSDPVAALVGKRAGWGPFTVFGHQKTLAGSLGFFVSAFVLCICVLNVLQMFEEDSPRGLIAFAVAGCATVAEALSHKGYDNLTIPAVALAIMIAFESV